MAGVAAVVFSAAAWFLLPRCKGFVWDVLKSDPDRYDQMHRDSVARDDEWAEARVRDLLRSELISLEHAARQGDAHEEALKFMRDTILQQGKEIQQLPDIAKAMTAISVTMKEIHVEVQEHGKRFERWDGYMEGLGEWDGRERRNRTRRKSE